MNSRQLNNRTLGNTPSLVGVSAEEAMLVDGGSIFSKLKAAAKWVYDHVYVDVKNHVIGGKGKF
jgi:hypothetical protein